MSKKLYEENNVRDIADAIREQNGTQNSYTVAQMGNAVRAIHTQPDLETLNATENGNYLPSAGKDGFSSVTVNVEGEAIIQPLSVTQNGTYNPPSGVDGYAPVTVNASGGGLGFDTLIGNQVFLSTHAGDTFCSYSVQYNDGKRWFTRTSNEPIIIIQIGTDYAGYGAIYFSDSLPTGTTGNQHGILVQCSNRIYQTPKGTVFNMAVMRGCWDKNTSRMQVMINDASTDNYRSYYQFNAATAVTYNPYKASEDAISNATPSQIAEIFALIDHVYETYYAN